MLLNTLQEGDEILDFVGEKIGELIGEKFKIAPFPFLSDRL